MTKVMYLVVLVSCAAGCMIPLEARFTEKEHKGSMPAEAFDAKKVWLQRGRI